MARKFFSILALLVMIFIISSCSSEGPNTKLFSSRTNPTLTLEEQMTLYKNMDLRGPILGMVNIGTYKVLEAKSVENDDRTWVKIEANGKTGWVFGALVFDGE